MRCSQIGWLALFFVVPTLAWAGNKSCVSAEEAARQINKEVCVSAHVYDVVRLPDGTQFLDLCTAETADEDCRFTIVSLWEDHDDVGELLKYRGENVRVRGIVRSMHGHAGLQLSHVRQFYGGREKFRPSPSLLRGFGGSAERPPVHDPNLLPQGRGRNFMNYRVRESRPVK